jgi:nitrogen fixation/metabolism regulation signal transduction histidine kinase
MLLAAAVNIGVVGYMAIHITHRMAGPMYSLVREVRRVKEGRWSGQMSLREDDELKFVVRNLNEMLGSLSSSAKQDLELVDDVHQKLENTISEGSQNHLTAALEGLTQLRLRIQSRLN